MCSYASPHFSSIRIPHPPLCSSLECIPQTQVPTARSECSSSTYIHENTNAPSGICKLVSNTQPHSSSNTANYCFLAVFSNQTAQNPIVFGFNCAPAGCWLVAHQTRVAYLREVKCAVFFYRLATAYTSPHTHTDPVAECVPVLGGAPEKLLCRANYTYNSNLLSKLNE